MVPACAIADHQACGNENSSSAKSSLINMKAILNVNHGIAVSVGDLIPNGRDGL